MSEHEPTEVDSDLRDASIGLALSGGGFRATAFHLGTLKRLEELGILPHISILSTVSGGSITGSLYALRCVQHGNGRPGTYPIGDLIEEIREVTTQNLRREALFGTASRSLQTAASFLTRAIPGLNNSVRRMPLLVDELDRQLFDGASLSRLPDWILINATNLATGKRWKFFSDRAGDYRVGATDKTEKIRVAEAVGASAAYPFLTDPYPFQSRWEHFKSELLDDRWRRPPQRRPGDISPWRRRYGRREGELSLPLVDGGIYDNLGLNSLRSLGVDYVVYSSASKASSAYRGGGLYKDVLQVAFSMHSRLGDVTRQHAHEMTHGMDPGLARNKLEEFADELRDLKEKNQESHSSGDRLPKRLDSIASSLKEISRVGWPPRGPQYRATAPIILKNTNVAEGDPPYDLPPEHRGLVVPLVKELARVRTDLDAHAADVIDLLIAQGYFAADAHLTVGMPELLTEATGRKDPRNELPPSWEWAHEIVERANANEEATTELLKEASEQKYLFGKGSL